MAQENEYDKSYHVYIGDTCQHGTITNTYKEVLPKWWDNPHLCYVCGHFGEDVHQHGTIHVGGHGEVPFRYCDDREKCHQRIYGTGEKRWIREEVDKLRKEVPK